MMTQSRQLTEKEEAARSLRWTKQLCETDRIIVESKRRDVQHLIQQFITEPVDSLAVVPIRKRRGRPPIKYSIPSAINLDWTTTDHFHQQISQMLGLQTTEIQVPADQKETMIVSKPERIDIKSLGFVMEKELRELGVTRMTMSRCQMCRRNFSTDALYANPRERREQIRCAPCWKANRPPRSMFHLAINEIADKWATMVGKRVECLYGNWDERLNPMVKMLKENVLLVDDIAQLLRKSMDPREFKRACDTIILTTIVFYLEYVDFRRSCEALIKAKPTVTHDQLFEIFAIYFPNRVKGGKMGDLL